MKLGIVFIILHRNIYFNKLTVVFFFQWPITEITDQQQNDKNTDVRGIRH